MTNSDDHSQINSIKFMLYICWRVKHMDRRPKRDLKVRNLFSERGPDDNTDGTPSEETATITKDSYLG